VEKLCGEAEKEPKTASKSTDFGEKTGVFAMFLPKKVTFSPKLNPWLGPKISGESGIHEPQQAGQCHSQWNLARGSIVCFPFPLPCSALFYNL
jgi:hypothetical protein